MSKAKIIGEILQTIVLVIGLASGIAAILQIGTLIGVLILGVSVTSALLWAFGKRFRGFASLGRLVGQEAVLQAISEVVNGSKIVVFIGNLTTDIWEIFKPKIQHNNGFELRIWNTDSRFYIKEENKKVVEEVVKLDAASAKFSHRYYFYKQHVHLLIGKREHQERQVFFFADPNRRLNGILARRGLRFGEMSIIQDAAPTISMVKQARSVHDVTMKTLEFWVPLVRGWFEPVFPPTNDKKVREIWREAILRWFMATAQRLAESKGKVRITWRLEEWSLRDAHAFSDWLKFLNTNKNVPVERYMLVDVARYKDGKDGYRSQVDEIVRTYLPQPLPRPTADRYQVWFLDRNFISKSLDDDFALFEVGDVQIAQHSIVDRMGDSEVLKIFFSQDYEEVNANIDRFNQLLDYNPKPTIGDLL